MKRSAESRTREPLRPWHEQVDAARTRDGKKVSLDDLAFEARVYGASKSLTGSQISQIKNGKRPYSTRFLEGIAGALAISPFEFAEYHLALARELLDEAHFGLDEALANIDVLPELIAEASEFAGEPDEGRRFLMDTSRQITEALGLDDESAEPETEEQDGQQKRDQA